MVFMVLHSVEGLGECLLGSTKANSECLSLGTLQRAHLPFATHDRNLGKTLVISRDSMQILMR